MEQQFFYTTVSHLMYHAFFLRRFNNFIHDTLTLYYETKVLQKNNC